jgi:hypothetical protein
LSGPLAGVEAPDEDLLVRVVTGLAAGVEPPTDDPDEVVCERLVRVVTGLLAVGLLAGVELPADDPDEVVCERLVRVVTGALDGADEPLDGAELPTADPGEVACEPLARVATAAVAVAPATTLPADPLACERLAPVRTVRAGLEPRPPGALARRRGPGDCPARSCRTMWIVRRITCVLTSVAGLRAASVATAGCVDLSENPARPAATTAATTPTVRVYVLLMFRASGLGSPPTVPVRSSVVGQPQAKIWQSWRCS